VPGVHDQVTTDDWQPAVTALEAHVLGAVGVEHHVARREAVGAAGAGVGAVRLQQSERAPGFAGILATSCSGMPTMASTAWCDNLAASTGPAQGTRGRWQRLGPPEGARDTIQGTTR
jgi:hypothetical protein